MVTHLHTADLQNTSKIALGENYTLIKHNKVMELTLTNRPERFLPTISGPYCYGGLDFEPHASSMAERKQTQ